jgi:hypothetical protein
MKHEISHLFRGGILRLFCNLLKVIQAWIGYVRRYITADLCGILPGTRSRGNTDGQKLHRDKYDGNQPPFSG